MQTYKNKTTIWKVIYKFSGYRYRDYAWSLCIVSKYSIYMYLFSDAHKLNKRVSTSSGIILKTTGAGSGSLNLQVHLIFALIYQNNDLIF